jgi:pyrimidine operon attenuation protein/uracil phosphoribosyltransferase
MAAESRVVLDAEAVARALRRIAGEIAERHEGAEDVLLVGIRRGGVPLAERLADLVAQAEGTRPPVGAVDITLYRDDASTSLPKPVIGPTELAFAIDRKVLILVDDVLFTGRTVRAALDEVLDFGRPRAIELVVLVDRGGRELPIRADYVGKVIDVAPDEHVQVTVGADGSGVVTVGKVAAR